LPLSIAWRLEALAEETLSSRKIFEGRALKLRVDSVRLPGGKETTREIVEHDDCVAIVALDEADNILLVRQFRKPVEKDLLEIPAGGIDPGEGPEDAVRREMREETGFLPQKVEKLGGFYSSPGFCTEYLHLYLATDLVESPLKAEDSEGITLVHVPLKEVRGLIASGAIVDAKSIAGLLAFLEYQKSADLV
jgi:ADP-ribose pyrophosphatase